jgi:hypothetical protein
MAAGCKSDWAKAAAAPRTHNITVINSRFIYILAYTKEFNRKPHEQNKHTHDEKFVSFVRPVVHLFFR